MKYGIPYLLSGLLSVASFNTHAAATPDPGAEATYSLSAVALQDVHKKTDLSLIVKGFRRAQAEQVQLKSFDTEEKLRWTRTLHNVPLTLDYAEGIHADFQYDA